MIRTSVFYFILPFILPVAALAAIDHSSPATHSVVTATNLSEQPLVRVRTHQRQSAIVISGFGLKLNGEKILSTTVPKKQRLKIKFKNGYWAIAAPADKKIRDRQIVIEGDFLQVGSTPVADRLILVESGKNRFDVVAELVLDDYLKGVLPSEMPIKWPFETLKAQVVASRSYALSQIRAHSGDDFHLDDSVMHQVFSWANYLNAGQENQARILKALDETRGEVLRDGDGEAYLAYFHSDCGGHTEEPNAVWGNGKKNGTVRDEHCALNAKSAWQEEITREEFDQKLAKYFGLSLESSHLASLQADKMSPSGRVQTLLAEFEHDPRRYKISGQNLRQIFGFSRIKSTNFQFEISQANIVFSGRGNGHGVGLCQQGARFMALAGADHRAILHRYYPRALLR